jgi:hypothetical protein
VEIERKNEMESEIKYGPILSWDFCYILCGDDKHGYNFDAVIMGEIDRLIKVGIYSKYPGYRVSHFVVEESEPRLGVDHGNMEVYLILVRKEN